MILYSPETRNIFSEKRERFDYDFHYSNNLVYKTLNAGGLDFSVMSRGHQSKTEFLVQAKKIAAKPARWGAPHFRGKPYWFSHFQIGAKNNKSTPIKIFTSFSRKTRNIRDKSQNTFFVLFCLVCSG